MYYSHYDSPIGRLLLVGDGPNIHRIEFAGTPHPVPIEPAWQPNRAVFATLCEELDAYFDGKLKAFSVTVAPEGSEFQRTVWSALQNIKYGQTCSYADIATSIGKPTACRAVGAANGRNPISIVIPCHRVIGSNGTLTGYAGGISAKQWLLSHETGEQSLFPFEQW